MNSKRKIIGGGIAAAAILSLGMAGGAVAGSLVTSADIKDNSIQSRDLKDGQGVGTADLKPGLANKISEGGAQGPAGPAGQDGAQGPKGDAGAQGPAGPAGPAGPKGDDGADGTDGADGADGVDGTDGLTGAVYRTLTYTNGGGGSATVACDDDPAVSQQYTAISGGVQGGNVDTQDDGFVVNSSFPGRMDWDTGLPKANRLDGWIILGNGEYTSTLTVWALCVPNTSIAVDAGTLDN